MTNKRPGLGRGLDALLKSAPEQASAQGGAAQDEVRKIPVDLLHGGRYQPRSHFDATALQELADSIRAQGVVQPIVVRPERDGRYEIIAGERRWRAAQLAGVHDVPALVRDLPEQAVVAVTLIENIQREDLNPLEEANALKRLTGEFEMSHKEVAGAVGRSRATVSNLLRLLELAEEVKNLIDDRRLEMGHARALLALDPPRQVDVARRVVARSLSVRDTESLVRRLLQQGEASPKSQESDPNLQRLQEDLSLRLGAEVRIQHGRTGKGRMIIQYNSIGELDGILERIK